MEEASITSSSFCPWIQVILIFKAATEVRRRKEE
jgi:hypothetical protein